MTDFRAEQVRAYPFLAAYYVVEKEPDWISAYLEWGMANG